MTPADLVRVAELSRDRDTTASRSKVTETRTPKTLWDTDQGSSTPGSLNVVDSALNDGLKSLIDSRSQRSPESLVTGHSDAGVTPLSTPDVSKHAR